MGEIPMSAVDITARLVMVTTMEDQNQLFTKRDVRSDSHACRLAQEIWSPSLRTPMKMVDWRRLKYCDITWDNIRNADTIYGLGINAIKGKMM